MTDYDQDPDYIKAVARATELTARDKRHQARGSARRFLNATDRLQRITAPEDRAATFEHIAYSLTPGALDELIDSLTEARRSQQEDQA